MTQIILLGYEIIRIFSLIEKNVVLEMNMILLRLHEKLGQNLASICQNIFALGH